MSRKDESEDCACDPTKRHAWDCPENPNRGVYGVRPEERAPPPAPPEVRAAWKEKQAEEDAWRLKRRDLLREGKWPPKEEDGDEEEDREEGSDQVDPPPSRI